MNEACEHVRAELLAEAARQLQELEAGAKEQRDAGRPEGWLQDEEELQKLVVAGGARPWEWVLARKLGELTQELEERRRATAAGIR